MRISIFLLLFSLLLVACGRAAPQVAPGTATPTPLPIPTATNTPPPPEPAATVPDASDVLAAFQAAGIQLSDIEMNPPPEEGSPLPRSFRQHVAFVDTLLGDKGGQVFICDEPKYCQALQAYFDALIALAGPYTFTSPSGLVVVQLNSGFTPDQAERYRTALDGF